ncbi:unnamed protein product [Nezara viridula]|uniref:Uncharacterized protein n=1 Tax=Nezara viridula TaxID=85310 RepID=A0A9P0HU09_NEZVI|nr:unnamed protein product [Nezara viridula]
MGFRSVGVDEDDREIAAVEDDPTVKSLIKSALTLDKCAVPRRAMSLHTAPLSPSPLSASTCKLDSFVSAAITISLPGAWDKPEEFYHIPFIGTRRRDKLHYPARACRRGM